MIELVSPNRPSSSENPDLHDDSSEVAFSRSRARSRPMMLLAFAFAAIGFLLLMPDRAMAESSPVEDQFVEMTNDLRSSSGLNELVPDEQLEAVAQNWAEVLSEVGTIAHNASLAEEVSGDWWMLGENVALGWEGGEEEIQQAWIDSPSHYANLVRPEFDAIGVGVAYDDYGGLYVVELFSAT